MNSMTFDRGAQLPFELNPSQYTSLNQFFDEKLAQFAHRPAFSSLGIQLTYRDLDRWSRAFALYLLEHSGLKPGDRIAIQLPNLVQYPIVVYGAMRAGMVVVNTNPLYTADEMETQFVDSEAKLLVIHSSMAHKSESILQRTQIKQVLYTQVGDFASPLKGTFLNFAIRYIKRMEPKFVLPTAKPLRAALDPLLDQPVKLYQPSLNDLAVLQYTGGTTGTPKGAMLTHANLLANILQGLECMKEAQEDWADQVISPLPLYHIYAFVVAQIIAARGGHSVLIPNPRDLNGFVRELKRWQPSAFIGLNTLFVGLCQQPHFARLDFSRLRLTLSGGMSLTYSAAQAWKEKTGSTIVEAYGLTEASPAVTTNDPLNPKIGSIGKPLVHTLCKVIDKDEKEVEPGEEGELVVKGPQVMRGYWNRDDETRGTFTSDGYLRTGDIAIQDAEGRFHIVDRAKDLIITSGFNVYPSELEDKISRHPQVSECAVVGVRDSVKGEAVRLFVIAEGSLTADDLKAWCRQQLTAYKCPRDIVFVDELPKSPVGKVLRRVLRSYPS